MDEEMTFETVYNKVRKVVAEVFSTDENQLSLETKFEEDLGAESLDFVTLLMEFEDAFDKKIPDEEAEKIVTLSDAVHYIMALTRETAQD